MNELTVGLGMLSRVVRFAALGVAGLVAVAALLAWLVRTRRISPFSGTARAIRRVTDPVFVPMDGRLARWGAAPAQSPLWTLGIVVVVGLLVIALVDFVAGQVLATANAFGSGPRGILRLVVGWAFALLQIALLVRVIASWVRANPYGRWVRWSVALTEWLLAPLRRVIPPLGMIDLSPLIAYFLLGILESLVLRLI